MLWKELFMLLQCCYELAQWPTSLCTWDALDLRKKKKKIWTRILIEVWFGYNKNSSKTQKLHFLGNGGFFLYLRVVKDTPKNLEQIQHWQTNKGSAGQNFLFIPWALSPIVSEKMGQIPREKLLQYCLLLICCLCSVIPLAHSVCWTVGGFLKPLYC